MTSQASAVGGRKRGLPRGHWIAAALLFLLVTLVMVGKFLHGDFKDAAVWYDAGRRVLSGDTLVGLPHYRYPPTFAVLVAPLTALGWAPFFFLWYGLNVGLFWLSVRLAGRIVHPETRRFAWGLPAILVAVFAINNLFLGQTNILIMALVHWAFWEDLRGRQWRVGLPLGAAIAIKVFPLPVVFYFAYRLRLAAAVGAVLSCALFLFALPGPVRGFRRNAEEVRAWAERVAVPFVSRGEAGDWGQHSSDFGNQSLPGVARRFLTRVDAQVAARKRPPIYVNVADLGDAAASRVVVALYGVLALAFTAAVGLRPPRRARRPGHSLRQATEYSLVTALLLLTSALSWTYFFVMLLLPAATALRLLEAGEALRRRTVFALRAALWSLPVATVLLTNHLARSLGCLFWSTLMFFAALALAAADLRRSEGEAAADGGEDYSSSGSSKPELESVSSSSPASL